MARAGSNPASDPALGIYARIPAGRVATYGAIAVAARAMQRRRLQREGVRFGARGSVDLAQYGWVARQST
jgi:alkylated DNA nucleotide flippase Atl1